MEENSLNESRDKNLTILTIEEQRAENHNELNKQNIGFEEYKNTNDTKSINPQVEPKNDEAPSGGQGMYFSNKLRMTIFG